MPVINITSGKLRVTDPCYNRDYNTTPGLVTVLDVPVGEWVVEGGPEEGRISIYRRDVSVTRRHPVSNIGVDSGQVCFADDSQYPVGDIGDYGDLNSFYGRVCRLTLNEDTEGRESGVLEDWCFASSTSYGDGTYPVEVGYSADDEVASVTVLFGDEDDEEYWGDEEDEW